jgi:hypothetical protein
MSGDRRASAGDRAVIRQRRTRRQAGAIASVATRERAGIDHRAVAEQRAGAIRTGDEWPSHCRSTPELDQFQAQFSALMPYREATGMLAEMPPLDAGKSHETLRRRTPNVWTLPAIYPQFRNH